MESISRRSALATIGQLSLAPALLTLGSPLLQRESGSGDDSPREVTARLLLASDFLYWHFSPGSHLIFEELANRAWPKWRTEVPKWQAQENCPPHLRRDCWPQWVERAKTEEMMYDYLGQPDGPLTPKRLWDLADSVGTPLTIFVSQRAADSGLMFPK